MHAYNWCVRAGVSVLRHFAQSSGGSGTLLFSAPETLLPGRARGYPSDIWSLGITCIELAEGGMAAV